MSKIKITKRELLFYVIIFAFVFITSLTLMSIDNLHWVTASPEWDSSHTVCNDLKCWEGPVQDYTFSEKVDYFTKYRIYTVFTHPRDLISVTIFSTGILFIIILIREIFKLNLLHRLTKWLN